MTSTPATVAATAVMTIGGFDGNDDGKFQQWWWVGEGHGWSAGDVDEGSS